MRAQAMPGEDPETLPHPSEIAARIVAAGRAQRSPETGLIYPGQAQSLRRYPGSRHQQAGLVQLEHLWR